MLIETLETPNPHARKYEPVMDEHEHDPFEGYPMGQWSKTAGASSLPEGFAGDILAVEGVCSVLCHPRFVSITKEKNQDWDSINAHVLDILQHALVAKAQGNLPDVQNTAASATVLPDVPDEDMPVVEKIAALLDKHVQPAVARDGGEMRFHHYHDGIVVLEMRGACSGCPSSMVTLKQGVERLLTTMIPEVREVRALPEIS